LIVNQFLSNQGRIKVGEVATSPTFCIVQVF
jgi:hypothetical protein